MRTRTKHYLLAATAAASFALAGLGYGIGRRRYHGTAVATTASEADGPGAQRDVLPGAARAAVSEIGAYTDYDVTIASDVTITMGALGPSDRPAAPQHRPQSTKARVRSLLLASTGQARVDLLTVRSSRLESGGVTSSEVPTTWRAGILVERDARGRVTRVRVAKGETSASTLRSLAELFEVTTPPSGDAREWTSDEAGWAGVAKVRYARRDAADAARVAWSKSASDVQRAVAPGEAPLTRPELRVALEGESDLASGDLVAERGEHEVTERALTTNQPLTVTREEVSVERVDRGIDRGAAIEAVRTLEETFGPWRRLDETMHVRDEAASARALETRIGGRSLEDVLRLARDAAHDPKALADLGSVLAPFLMRHPEASAPVGEALAAAGPRAPAGEQLLLGLMLAGHADAQRAIVDAARARRDLADGPALLKALGSIKGPSIEVENYLRDVRADAKAPGEAARAATLSLGAVAGQVRTTDPGRADAIADEIADAIERDDGSHLAVDLAALGNARSPRAAEIATAHLGDDDAMVRRMAVFALSRVDTPSAREAIARLAQSDRDESVRDAAKRALATGG